MNCNTTHYRANSSSVPGDPTDVAPVGQTDPIPGLEAAFKAKPDLLHVLTDGEFHNNAAVRERVAALNRGGRTRVNTIAFVSRSDDPVSSSFEAFLRTLAKENGGVYHRVSRQELD